MESPKTSLGFYPGTISRIPVDAHYPGCKTVFFWSIHSYNRFFEERPGQDAKPFVVVEAIPTPYLFGLLIGMTVTYTKQLTPNEQADLDFVTREVDLKLAERRAKRDEAEYEQRTVKAAADQEQARLALIGKKYEDRVKHMKASPTMTERNNAEDALNGGDPEVLFGDKLAAFQAGYVKGRESVKQGDN